MKKKNLIWLLMLIIGFIPFAFPLLYGIKNAIFGYSGLCLFDCSLDYGFSAFIEVISSHVFPENGPSFSFAIRAGLTIQKY